MPQTLKTDKPVIGDILLKLLVDSTSLPELKALIKDACRVLITHDKLMLERIAKEVALVEAQKSIMDTETQMHQARAAALEAEARVFEAEARVLEAEARVLEAKNTSDRQFESAYSSVTEQETKKRLKQPLYK